MATAAAALDARIDDIEERLRRKIETDSGFVDAVRPSAVRVVTLGDVLRCS